MTENTNRNVGRWSQEEHQLFLVLLEEYGRDWEAVGKKIMTRTELQIRSHAQKFLRKLKRKRDTIKRGNISLSEDQVKYLHIFERPNVSNIQSPIPDIPANFEVCNQIQDLILKQDDFLFSTLKTKDYDQTDCLLSSTSLHPLKTLIDLNLVDFSQSFEYSNKKNGWVISSYPGSLKSYQAWKNIIHK